MEKANAKEGEIEWRMANGDDSVIGVWINNYVKSCRKQARSMVSKRMYIDDNERLYEIV